MKWNSVNKFLLLLSSQALEPEKRYILRNTLKRGDIPWDEIIIRSIKEGINSFLFLHLKDEKEYIPDYVIRTLKEDYEQIFTMNLVFMRFLEELEDLLSSWRGPRIMVIKGASLLGCVYDDIGLRPMEDIDILVHERELKEVGGILKRIGFSKDPVYPTTYKKGLISVDLHTDILSSHRIRSRRYIAKINNRNLWTDSAPLFNEGYYVLRPSIEHTIIILCFHLLKHNFERLIWLVDIAEIVKKHSLHFKWSNLLESARNMGAQRAVLYPFIIIRDILGIDVPDEFLKELSQGEIGILEKKIINIIELCDHKGRLPQLLYLFLIDGWLKRIIFLKENILPSRAVINQCSVDGKSNSITYNYLRRLMEISLDIMLDVVKVLKVSFR